MTDLGRCVFTYEYEWVNRGEWRTCNDEGEAVDRAGQAAIKAGGGLWRQVYDSTVTLIERQPCDKNHLHLCTHLRVSFWQNDLTPTQNDGKV